MKTAAALTVRRTAADMYEKATAVRQEQGLRWLARRVGRRLVSPFVKWGGVAFFERRLDSTDLPKPRTTTQFCARQFEPAEIDALLEGGDPTQDATILAARFRRGDRAFGAVDADGKVCHVRWVATTPAYIPEIGCDIVPRLREAYFYNGYTRPDARRRGVDGLVRRFIFDTLRAEGFETVCSYARLDNPVGLRAAARWQHAIGTVHYVAPFRFRPIVSGMSHTGLPLLTMPARPASRERVDAWRAWFTSWLGQPLAQRSTGCAVLDEDAFESTAAFIGRSLALARDTDRVLDVGCDSAMITRLIAPRVRRLMGIDFIHEMLRDTRTLDLATAAGHMPWFVTGDGCSLPLRSGTFTKVYCSAMLHTLPTRAHGLQAIEELIRVTAAGGIVLVSSVPDRAKRLASRLDLWKRARAADKFTLPVRWLLPGAIKRMIRRVFRRPSTGLPAFLDYDLAGIARSLTARGFRCEVRDFPDDYWSGEFKTSRSNLLIFVP